jgi:hypothetical protein
LCAATAGSSGCELARDLLPRTHTVSTSPDGRTHAFVRQHLNPDPPDDHLYVVPPDGIARHVMALAPDRDWCRTIVWSPDNRRVGFAVNDERLAVFNTSTLELEAMLLLVTDDSHEARAIALTSDSVVSFDLVARALVDVPQRGRRVVQVPRVQIARFHPDARIAKPERMLGRHSLTIPAARLQLRMQSPEGRSLALDGWARMVTPDQRQVHVPFSSTPDGLVRLPAFAPGPFSIVEVARLRSRRTAVLHDVAVGDTPVNVTIPAQ